MKPPTQTLDELITEIEETCFNHWGEDGLSADELDVIDRLTRHPDWYGPSTREEFIQYATRVGVSMVKPVYPVETRKMDDGRLQMRVRYPKRTI